MFSVQSYKTTFVVIALVYVVLFLIQGSQSKAATTIALIGLGVSIAGWFLVDRFL